MDIPLEVNILGMIGKRHYPSERFYRIAAEVGNRFVLGVDAHNAAALTDPTGEAMAREFCRKIGITPEENVKLIPPTK
jgi:histidinol-phosphatase (PHP family)